MDKVNEFIAIPKNGCKPMPQYNEEFLNVINSKGEEDQLLLLHIQPCVGSNCKNNKRFYLFKNWR